MELHAGFDLIHALEHILGEFLLQVVVALAIRLGRLDGDLDLVAGSLALQGGFQAGDDIADAEDKGKGFIFASLVDQGPLIVFSV